MTTLSEKLRKRLKALYGKSEGAYPDMPQPEDRSDPLPVEGFNDLGPPVEEYEEMPPPRLPAAMEAPPRGEALPAPSDQAEHDAFLKKGQDYQSYDASKFGAVRPKPSMAELQDEEGGGDYPMDPRAPEEPGMWDKTKGYLKDAYEGIVNKGLGYRGDHDSSGNPTGSLKGAGGAKQITQPKHPTVDYSKAAQMIAPGASTRGSLSKPLSMPESEWPAVKEPDQPTSGMSEQPLGPEAPLQSLATDAPPEDRPFDPYDPRDAEETGRIEGEMFGQMPDEGKVGNHELAAARNVTSTVASNSDAMKAMQKERAPEDQSAYYAALKQMAGAFGTFGNQNALGYYDAKIAQEKQGQKDWQARLAAELKNKFDSGQKDLDRKALLDWRNRQGDQKDRGLDIAATRANRVNLNVAGIDERMYTRMAEKAGGKLPGGGEVASMNDVLAQLDAGGPQGTGYFMNKDGWQSFLRSPKGVAFRQAVLSVINPHIKRQHGATVTPGEEERAMGQYGYGTFNSPEDLDSGMRRVAMEMQANINQTIAQLPPESRAMLEGREGAIPKIGGNFGKPPAATLRKADSEENFNPNSVIPDFTTKPGESSGASWWDKTKSWLNEHLSVDESVKAAIAQQDEEERKRLRPNQ